MKEGDRLPKLIENLRENILAAAKAELLARGYSSLNIRGVAKECGIAVGTVYNYFPSKDMLAASVMLSDWLPALERARAACASAANVPEALSALYGEIEAYYCVYRSVWEGYTFTGSGKTEYSKRHLQLVTQLAGCLRPALERLGVAPAKDMAIFLAENVLICAGNSDMTFDMLMRILGRIF